MYQENVVLCSASKYTEKYYLNPDFNGLPELIRQELQIMCVLFAEDIGGIIMLEFDEEGNLNIKTHCEEDDLLYDDIGSVLKVNQIIQQKEALFEQLEQYYRVFFLHED